jgi:hypothetical protein
MNDSKERKGEVVNGQLLIVNCNDSNRGVSQG